MTKRLRSRREEAGRQERRKARRFDAAWEVSITGTDPSGSSFNETGTLENLSSTGAFLFLTRNFEVGERVDILIKIPFKSDNWMRYSAEIVRVEAAPPRIGVGMRFDTPRPAFVERQPPG
ncbi:MAG TPA: PilZ domain-containing protein [Blastocatellia bacterium]|nr:PilZ domain-containing protein [Blastocatellia bacterium]